MGIQLLLGHQRGHSSNWAQISTHGRVTLKHKQPSIVWVSGIVKLWVFILPMCFILHLTPLAFWPLKGSWKTPTWLSVSRWFLKENTDAWAPNLVTPSPALSKINHEFPKAFAFSPKRDIFSWLCWDGAASWSCAYQILGPRMLGMEAKPSWL